MKKIFTAIAVSLLLTSCSITGLTNDYSKLTEADKVKIVALETFFLSLFFVFGEKG